MTKEKATELEQVKKINLLIASTTYEIEEKKNNG